MQTLVTMNRAKATPRSRRCRRAVKSASRQYIVVGNIISLHLAALAILVFG
jgi:hypothetical protein